MRYGMDAVDVLVHISNRWHDVHNGRGRFTVEQMAEIKEFGTNIELIDAGTNCFVYYLFLDVVLLLLGEKPNRDCFCGLFMARASGFKHRTNWREDFASNMVQPILSVRKRKAYDSGNVTIH
jgi:hypothetical protein